jgi:hypothetical protein
MKAFLLMLVFTGWFGIKHTVIVSKVTTEAKAYLINHQQNSKTIKTQQHSINKITEPVSYFEIMLLPVMAL